MIITKRYDYETYKRKSLTYDPNKKEERSRTLQSAKDETNINSIMKRYEKTGMLRITKSLPRYGDFSEVGDYRSVLCKIAEMQKFFMRLPAKVRSKFNNDVAEMLDFIADPKNKEEAIKIGLKKGPDPEDPAVPPAQNSETPVEGVVA